MSIAFRRAEPRDLPFVIASWADSFQGSHAAGVIPAPLYDSIYRDQVIPWILERSGVSVWVAYHPDETDPRMDIHGWVCVERDVERLVQVRVPSSERGKRVWESRLEPTALPLLHYVFVKQPKRRLGIAKRLFTTAGIDLEQPFLFSFRPASWNRLRHLAPLATWEPAIARREKREHVPRQSQAR